MKDQWEMEEKRKVRLMTLLWEAQGWGGRRVKSKTCVKSVSMCVFDVIVL